MNVVSFFRVLTVLPAMATSYPALCQAVAANDTDYGVVRQCTYATGLVLRLPSARKCPPLPLAAQTSPGVVGGSAVAVQSPTPPSKSSVNDSSNNAQDEILSKAVSRCATIGYERDTDDYRKCVSEQIRILSGTK